MCGHPPPRRLPLAKCSCIAARTTHCSQECLRLGSSKCTVQAQQKAAVHFHPSARPQAVKAANGCQCLQSRVFPQSVAFPQSLVLLLRVLRDGLATGGCHLSTGVPYGLRRKIICFTPSTESTRKTKSYLKSLQSAGGAGDTYMQKLSMQ